MEKELVHRNGYKGKYRRKSFVVPICAIGFAHMG